MASYEDYRKTPIGVRSMRIEVESRIRRGEKTTLTFSDLRKIDASGLDFTREGLSAIRDAAMAYLKSEGVQVGVEELVARVKAAGP